MIRPATAGSRYDFSFPLSGRVPRPGTAEPLLPPPAPVLVCEFKRETSSRDKERRTMGAAHQAPAFHLLCLVFGLGKPELQMGRQLPAFPLGVLGSRLVSSLNPSTNTLALTADSAK